MYKSAHHTDRPTDSAFKHLWQRVTITDFILTPVRIESTVKAGQLCQYQIALADKENSRTELTLYTYVNLLQVALNKVRLHFMIT